MEDSRTTRALYGVFCEALNAVHDAIKSGADIGDLENAIEDFDPSNHRIVKKE